MIQEGDSVHRVTASVIRWFNCTTDETERAGHLASCFFSGSHEDENWTLLIVLNENRRILTEAGAEGAPDLVVEVLSPKTRQLDLVNKKRVYARMGIKELWIIDPDEKNVTVYRFDQDPSDPVATLSGEGEVSSPLLPGLAIVLLDIFRRG